MEAAKNLTLEAGLVEPSPEVRAAPRRHLVIFEDSRDGRRFLKTLPPGELFRPGFFQKPDRFWAFLVSAEPEHRHSFSRVCETLDHRHVFTLHFELRFRVSVAQLLVESQDRDPLRELEERAAKCASTRISQLNWDVIWEGGSELQAALRAPMADEVGMRRSLVEILDAFARAYGLQVLGLEIQRTLPETAQGPTGKSLEVDRELEKTEDRLRLEEQKKRHQKQLEIVGIRDAREIGTEQHELDLQKLQQNTELKARTSLLNVIQVLQEMLTRSGSTVQSFPEMRHAVRELEGIRDQVTRLARPLALPGTPDLGPRPAELPSADSTVVDGEVLSSTSGSGLWQLLGELRDRFSLLPYDVQRSILPAILRLIAAVLANPIGTADDLEEPRQAVRAVLEQHLDDLDDDQNAWLRRLPDLHWLQAQLKES